MTATATKTTAPGPVASLPGVPADWRVTPEGNVRVSDVARTAGDYDSVNYAVRHWVPIVDQHGQGRSRYIPVAEGLLLLAAAALAVAAGVALSQMYRAIKASGATVSGSGLTIPLNIAS
ncbi:hypothetical protein OG756_42355 (plasmid) [Streptomyces sp. NBC_01310]|uniref:hypothetical protein n=1 Tax=Streptomyces sp. NBC_01310 TaxID=2903820 RepID=UPI0035B5E122|nr:hypothetical protein OG756_42355 [Streptomyces sp. NBC_01310]